MRLLVLSDLHIESAAYEPPTELLGRVDAVILAGDIMPNTRQLPAWAARPSMFGSKLPIVIVPGNHEFYGNRMEAGRFELQEAAKEHPNVHVLDQGEVLLDGGRLRILGCTLWTDFAVRIQTRAGLVSHPEQAMATAATVMLDYRRITVADGVDEQDEVDQHADGTPQRVRRRALCAQDTLGLHHEQRAWLLAKLAEPFDGQTVVVTHHGPAAGSIAPRWAADWATPAFASDLPDAFFEVPSLWVHGHTHDSRRYRRGRTDVVCNPRGYMTRTGRFENPQFAPELVVEV